MPDAPPVLTIGHSNHPWERFVALLAGAGVTALADVRSAPHSRHTPQFGRERLAAGLRAAGIAYVFLGRELGGRPADRSLLTEGVADYERMARQPCFARGLERVIAGAARHRIALMCAEQDPLDCHRCLLVARRLAERGVAVGHILADGRIETQAEAEDRLLAATRRAGEDLFASRAERLALAYREQARRAAFREEQSAAPGQPAAAE
ncbi:DUF488 domain-containing protein [Caldovatus sediminis]|nr:DUF488 domain-containing protein [Caldovatus sediminis]